MTIKRIAKRAGLVVGLAACIFATAALIGAATMPIIGIAYGALLTAHVGRELSK